VRRLSLAILLILATCIPVCAAEAPAMPAFTRTENVIYGYKYGMALTMDVFRPAKPSGIGVLFMVSGGWWSAREMIGNGNLTYKECLQRGQTVFAVCHGSQPKFTIPEIVGDIQHAVRFIRFHAQEYGVDPNRLGITGGSSGGHLSLMAGARGADGDPAAKDPVDRVSSRIQAVACLFPPVDLVNYGAPGVNFLDPEILKPFRTAFPLTTGDAAERERVAGEVSPIRYVTKEMPPTLVLHGDADKLVPLQQSELLMKKLEELGVPHRLVVGPGRGHNGGQFAGDIHLLAEWFDQYLKK
jgi:acetyl esterase/lipase